jgi:hypothetical protein
MAPDVVSMLLLLSTTTTGQFCRPSADQQRDTDRIADRCSDVCSIRKPDASSHHRRRDARTRLE